MKQVITTEQKPIKLWLDDIEEGALQQARNLANLPFTFKWVSIMPDSHQGYGMPIGGVLATTGAIIPNAVGVDIGCGMCAVKTSLQSIESEQLKHIMGGIRQRVPLGFEHHKEAQKWEGFDCAPDVPIVQQELNKSRYQLGTLGGGNHFIEIQRGSDGHIWLMLHSGSRNFGLKIANEYHRQAQRLCERWYSSLPDKDLAFLPIEEREAKEYVDAMNFALDFAKANRYAMIEAMKSSVNEVIGCVEFDETINIHHNYAVWEHHFNHNVIVHRKGATSAKDGQLGIIPGSQGTKSYIVRGKGNPESFMSCSHGAGRKMGRKQAQRELDLEVEKKRLDDQGIIHAIRSENDLDEASGAYKDIGVVMENQSDLVDIVVELSPLAVIKA
jgi:tRNA-splicing ligase RtcB